MRLRAKVIGILTAALAAAATFGIARTVIASRRLVAVHRRADPQSCAACHRMETLAWASSHHALAEVRPFFSPPAAPAGYPHPVGWLGVDPLRQLLVPLGRGRIQASSLAYDPRRSEWFEVFGAEIRKPGEWGHWTGRGMNWNSECAWCHNTDVAKNYDPDRDAYATTVGHPGVACAACHGDGSVRLTPAQIEDTCAACHSRREDLTGTFHPGEPFFDHFTLATVDETDVFYPDGQVKEEDFEYSAFLGSKMHAAGVRCLDCHDPHSGRTLAAGNALCLNCHASGKRGAPIIAPEAHSHHAAGGPGDLCVNCHMPVTVYMQRHQRRDHGFTIPDPLLTERIGVPNACNRCHADRSAAWAAEAADRWYGAKMNRPTRDRALVIADARQGDAGASPALRRMIQSEPIPYWRAVAATLLAPSAGTGETRAALGLALRDRDPLVRSAAASALAQSAGEGNGDAQAELRSALADPSRSVRVAAAWGLHATLDLSTRAGADLVQSLAFNADQPTGAYRLGIFDFDRGEIAEARRQFERAIAWDPLSAGYYGAAAVAESAGGDRAAALTSLRRACALEPANANWRFELGLALNDQGDLSGARQALAEAVRLDPDFPRAWYNLAVASYRAGDIPAARAEAEEALRRQPDGDDARRLLEEIGSLSGRPASGGAPDNGRPAR